MSLFKDKKSQAAHIESIRTKLGLEKEAPLYDDDYQNLAKMESTEGITLDEVQAFVKGVPEGYLDTEPMRKKWDEIRQDSTRHYNAYLEKSGGR